jgi:hypothetical protein
VRTFRPGEYLTWDPTPLQSGGPTVVNRGLPLPGHGWRSYTLRNNPTRASSAEILTSFGCDAGFPLDDHGAPLAGSAIDLAVIPLFSFSSFFFNGGTMASATTRSRVAIFVEEFDARGRFVRALDGQEQVVIDLRNTAWVSGSVESSPFQPEHIIIPAIGQIPVRAGFQYRAWVDLWGEMQAAGFPPIQGTPWRSPFGSTSHVQMDMHVSEISTSFGRRL